MQADGELSFHLKNASKVDNFLNVLQVMEVNKTPMKIKKSYSKEGKYVAVEIGNNIVAQNLALGINDEEITLSIGKDSKLYKVIITDLKGGLWNVQCGFGQKFTVKASVNGVLAFESRGGDIHIYR